MYKYDVYSLDVLGSNSTGYEVNDLSNTGLQIELPEEYTDRDIIKALKEVDYLNKHCRYNSFEIDGDEYTLYVDYNTTKIYSRPIAQLRLIEV